MPPFNPLPPTRKPGIGSIIAEFGEDVIQSSIERSERNRQEAHRQALIGIQQQTADAGTQRAETGVLNQQQGVVEHQDFLKTLEREREVEAAERKHQEALLLAQQLKQEEFERVAQFHIARARDPRGPEEGGPSQQEKRASEAWMGTNKISSGFLENVESRGGTVSAISAQRNAALLDLEGLASNAFDTIIDSGEMPGLAPEGIRRPGIEIIDPLTALADESVLQDMAREWYIANRASEEMLRIQEETGLNAEGLMQMVLEAFDARKKLRVAEFERLNSGPGGFGGSSGPRVGRVERDPEPQARSLPKSGEAGSTTENLQVTNLVERFFRRNGFNT